MTITFRPMLWAAWWSELWPRAAPGLRSLTLDDAGPVPARNYRPLLLGGASKLLAGAGPAA